MTKKIISATMKSGIVPVSQQTLDLFDEIAQGLFGEKVTDLKQQYLVVKEEAKRQEEEAKQQFAIIRLHGKSKLSAKEIAEQLRIELSIVECTINEFF